MGAAHVGIGDEIMAGALARQKHIETGKRVRILDRFGAVRLHQVWQGLDYIAHPADNGQFAELVNGPSARPYIRAKHADRWEWDYAYRAPLGELHLWPDEREFAVNARAQYYVVVEPHLKRKSSPNKDWGWRRWNRLVFELERRNVRVAQVGPAGTALLDGVKFIETPTFRHAAAVLAQSRGAVLPEGGLHHAAAALGVPAVVLFGGYIAVEMTGYECHLNIGAAGTDACGSRTPCGHCAAWMARIEPGSVAAAIAERIR